MHVTPRALLARDEKQSTPGLEGKRSIREIRGNRGEKKEREGSRIREK